MTIQEFRDYMASGKPVVGGGDVHMMFHQLSQERPCTTGQYIWHPQFVFRTCNGHQDLVFPNDSIVVEKL